MRLDDLTLRAGPAGSQASCATHPCRDLPNEGVDGRTVCRFTNQCISDLAEPAGCRCESVHETRPKGQVCHEGSCAWAQNDTLVQASGLWASGSWDRLGLRIDGAVCGDDIRADASQTPYFLLIGSW